AIWLHLHRLRDRQERSGNACDPAFASRPSAGGGTADRRGGAAEDHASASGEAMSPITTHVLDTALGRPAAGIAGHLERQTEDNAWAELGAGITDRDGRLRDLVATETKLPAGVYRLRFLTDAYFRALGTRGFYPEVAVQFHFDPGGGHYHVPLLLSP